MTHLLLTLTRIFPLALIGFILAATARSRRGIVFGVSLPLEVADSATVRAAIRRFRLRLLALTVCCVALIVTLAVLNRGSAAALASSVGTFVLLLAAYLLRCLEGRRLRPQAIHSPLSRTADLLVPDSTIALALSAAPLLFLGVIALWLHMHWSQIPARWPQHWNAEGQVDGYGHRSAAGVFAPLGLGAFMALVLTAISAFNAKAPGPQMRQRARFAAPLAAISWAITAIFCLLGLLPLYHFSLALLLNGIGLSMVAILGIVVWSLVRVGFLGSTLTMPAYDGTPDSHWHAGLFYANRNDPAVLVPKRFGYGWTLNFARPVAWIFSAVILLLCVASAVVPLLRHKH